VRHVPRIYRAEQLVPAELQHRRAGLTRAAGLNLLHNLRDRFSASQAVDGFVNE
jgi:hypothetical protein